MAPKRSRPWRNRPRFRKRARTYKKAYRQRNRRTAGFLGIELKFLDTDVSAQAVATTVPGSESDPTTFLGLNSIAAGDGESNRDGRKAKMHSINLKGVIIFNAETDDVNPPTLGFCRVWIIKDKQTNGVQLSAEQVFKDPTSAEMDQDPMINLQYKSRFSIVKKVTVMKHYPVSVWDSAANNTNTNGSKVPFSMYARVSDDVHYSNTTGVIANITDVSYHVICIGSANLDASISYTSRVRFYG